MIMSKFFVLILCRRLFCQSFPNPMYLFINHMPNVYLNGMNCIQEQTSNKARTGECNIYSCISDEWFKSCDHVII